MARVGRPLQPRGLTPTQCRMFLAPASISVIDYFADGPVSLRSFNDSAHL